MRLLVTRPEPDASRTAEALRRRGHEALVAPLLRIEPIAADIAEGPWSGILVTSANAARAIDGRPLSQTLLGLPVIAVGRRSAEALEDAGFGNVTSAEGNVDELVHLARTRFAGVQGPLLYLAGEQQAGDVAGKLAEFGLPVRTVVVYRAVAATALDGPARDALAAGRIDGVLHYSPRSALVFLACISSAGLAQAAQTLTHYCLSAEVAAALAGAANVKIAARPDEAALLDLIGPAEGRESAPP